MRGCARFLVWLEPWLRRLVSEAARWARVGTRTVPNGQLRIDRARRGSNGHPSAAMLQTGVTGEAAVGDEFRESPLRTTPLTPKLPVSGRQYNTRRGTGHSRRRTKLEARRARYMYGCYRMSRVVGSYEPLSVARRDAETRRTHQHKPPTCAWRGGRRVQHTGMGRRHPVHRCSRHKLRTEITAERRRRQRSMAGLGMDDADERETAGDGGRQREMAGDGGR
jgi:hypothetical protein